MLFIQNERIFSFITLSLSIYDFGSKFVFSSGILYGKRWYRALKVSVVVWKNIGLYSVGKTLEV